MPSDQLLTIVIAGVGVANLVLNLRLQLVHYRLRQYIRDQILGHLADYHGVKVPRPWGEEKNA